VMRPSPATTVRVDVTMCAGGQPQPGFVTTTRPETGTSLAITAGTQTRDFRHGLSSKSVGSGNSRPSER
jgi:hypothetical protein